MALLLTLPPELLLEIADHLLTPPPAPTTLAALTSLRSKPPRDPIFNLRALSYTHPILHHTLSPLLFTTALSFRYHPSGKTLLHLPHISPSTIISLLSFGLFIDVRDASGSTPLHYAAAKNEVAYATLLLQHGASVDATTTATGLTPLHHATTSEMISLLLNWGAQVDALSYDGLAPLHLACRSSFAGDIHETLIAGGADVELPGCAGTPMDHAVRMANCAAIRVLLRHGAVLGEEAGRRAARWGSIEMLRIVVEAAGVLDQEMLVLAVERCPESAALDGVGVLLEAPEVRVGRRAVVAAAKKGYVKVLRALMEKDLAVVEIYRKAVVSGEINALRDDGKKCEYTVLPPLYRWVNKGKGPMIGFGPGTKKDGIFYRILEWEREAAKIGEI